jgi:hypothetical protein
MASNALLTAAFCVLAFAVAFLIVMAGEIFERTVARLRKLAASWRKTSPQQGRGLAERRR